MVFIVEDISNNLFQDLAFRNFLIKSRGINEIDFNNLNKYFLYTGRGPSTSSFHLGHLIGLKLTLSLYQKYFSSNKIFFMLSDDEKIFRDNIDDKIMKKNIETTILMLNKIGFNISNTFIKKNSIGLNEKEYSILIKLMNTLSFHQLKNIYGDKNNIGDYFYFFIQMIPCFLYPSKTCIVVAGEDQDTYFRVARDLARKCKFKPPIILYHKTVFGLDGTEKMSSSIPSTIPIFIDDTPKQIMKKINSIKYVGVGTKEELILYGSDLTKDIPYQIIELFDNKINTEIISKGYTLGHNLKVLNKLFTEDEIIKINENNYKILTKGIRRYLKDLIISILNFS